MITLLASQEMRGSNDTTNHCCLHPPIHAPSHQPLERIWDAEEYEIQNMLQTLSHPTISTPSKVDFNEPHPEEAGFANCIPFFPFT